MVKIMFLLFFRGLKDMCEGTNKITSVSVFIYYCRAESCFFPDDYKSYYIYLHMNISTVVRKYDLEDEIVANRRVQVGIKTICLCTYT